MPPYETFRVFRTLTITEFVDVTARTQQSAEQAVELLLERGDVIDWTLIGDETNVKLLYGETQNVTVCDNIGCDNYIDSGMIDLDKILENITHKDAYDLSKSDVSHLRIS